MGVLYLFQVRPLILLPQQIAISASQHHQLIAHIAEKITTSIKPHPYLLGNRAIYGVMPDWNPAEMIG
ncbi:hypothetical protein ABTB15_19760, partial [Acinetobacter baumannii]